MKLTEIIGKQIISMYDSTYVGTIGQAVFDEKIKKIKGFLVFDNDDNELYLSLSKIHSIGDFIIVKNTFVFDKYVLYTQNILNKTVVNTDGKIFGQLADIQFNQQGEVETMEFENNTIKEFKVLSVNEIITLFGEKSFCIKSLKPKKIYNVPTIQEQNVKILETQPVIPQKVNAVQANLIGKKVSENIFGKNNEVIIKKNQTITPYIIDMAQKHNRVNNLYFSVY